MVEETIIRELLQLSLSFDFVQPESAKDILDTVNGRIAEQLSASVIEIFWMENAREGIILSPFTWINREGALRPDPRPYTLDPGKGLSGYLYKSHKKNPRPVWIEISAREPPGKFVIDKVTGDELPLEYYKGYDRDRSIVATALTFKDAFWGVYSLEFPYTGKFGEEDLSKFQRLSQPVARILWKADAFKLNSHQTRQAISNFREAIRAPQEEPLSPYRAGVIIRAFDPDLKELDSYIKNYFGTKGIHVEHYEPQKNEAIVIEDIMRLIKSSHFAIIDITGFKQNVMIELGMAMILGKRRLLLRWEKDEGELPFDLKSYHCHKYRIRQQDAGSPPDIQIWDPGTSDYLSIDVKLDKFIEELEQDPVFSQAKRP